MDLHLNEIYSALRAISSVFGADLTNGDCQQIVACGVGGLALCLAFKILKVVGGLAGKGAVGTAKLIAGGTVAVASATYRFFRPEMSDIAHVLLASLADPADWQESDDVVFSDIADICLYSGTITVNGQIIDDHLTTHEENKILLAAEAVRDHLQDIVKQEERSRILASLLNVDLADGVKVGEPARTVGDQGDDDDRHVMAYTSRDLRDMGSPPRCG